ncbi:MULTISPECIES: hypothetical protein [Streptomyces]|nr:MULTISPECIES: hypothetical protein [Streptomyces]
MSEQPVEPTVGDRYVKRTAPEHGRIVTVTRVWTADDGHTAVAYEWRDDKPGRCGSACPLAVFHRTYRRYEKPLGDTARALTTQEQQARRDSLLVLLSRAQRGVLTTSEAGLLRAHVGTELDAADRYRNAWRSARQRARRRDRSAVYRLAKLQERRAQIRAAEQRAEQAEAAVERVRETARRHGPALTADEIEHALAAPEQPR